MTKPSIHFRTRGGPNHGWGNIHRLADFAGRCRDGGHDAILFFAEGPPEVARYLSGRGFKTVALAEDISLEDEREILASHPKGDVMISEMLDCAPGLQALLGEHAAKLVIFDDLLDHRYAADLVVCAQALPAYGNIEVSAPGTEFLCGYDYFMFGPAYRGHEGRRRIFAETVSSVLVAFGGGSYDAAYLKAAKALAKMPSGPKATFVLGFAAEETLRNELGEILPNAAILGGVENMAELLANTDLAIVSAGYLKLEAAITRTPAILVATQWHQLPLAEEFVKRTGAPYAGYMGFMTSDDIAQAAGALSGADARSGLAERARKVVDGRGFERVYRAIFEDAV